MNWMQLLFSCGIQAERIDSQLLQWSQSLSQISRKVQLKIVLRGKNTQRAFFVHFGQLVSKRWRAFQGQKVLY